MPVNLDDYEYDLPECRIAQSPAERRETSRLMVLGPGGGIEHTVFSELGDHLRPGDLLVVNDTRVFPARLIGEKEDTGGEAEIFLLRPYGNGEWDALCRPARRLRPGAVVVFGGGRLRAEICSRGEDGMARVRLEADGDIDRVVEDVGRTPLPPYIRRPPTDADRERYQTVYARQRGAVAAPTAGLHFTRQMLDNLDEHGIGNVALTLHVGIGTFRPLDEAGAAGDRLHGEYCSVPAGTVERIRSCRAGGGRVIAVGTTTARALETAAAGGVLEPFDGWTDIFIKPPYRFRALDGMVTNFHLPRSSLLMMVSALAGRDRIMAAYREAVERGYRFYSYGDAMLILDVAG